MNITVGERFSFCKYHSLYRCEVLIHSKEFRSRNRPKSVPEIWGITQPFHNLQYCATYKAGYTFWKYLFGANPGKIDEASLIKPEFTAQRKPPHTVSMLGIL